MRNLGIFFVLVGCLSAKAAVVSWDGGGDGATWQDANNWSADQTPGTADDVVISIPGTNFTVMITANAFVRSLQCDHSLSVSNGALRVTAGASRVDGTLTVAARRTLEVNGAGATFSANGAVQLVGANLLARGGATLALPTLAQYVDAPTCCGSTLQASGAGSVLDLSSVTNFIGVTVVGWDTAVEALTGGQVRLGGLKRVENAVIFNASGANSIIRVPLLDDFAGTSGRLTFQATLAGQIESPSLVRADRTRFIRRSGGVIPMEQITTLTQGNITVDGALNLNMLALTNVDRADLFVQNGATVTFPAVTSYTDGDCCGTELSATGAGSRLNFPALTNFAGNPVNGWHTYVRATSGGRVEWTNLTHMSAFHVRWIATGSNSVIQAPGFVNFQNDIAGQLVLEAVSGGAVSCPGLTDADRVVITVSGNSSIPLAQITTLAHGGLSLFTGQHLTLSALTNVDGANLILKSNTVLTLPNVRSFTDINGCCGQLWQVTGAGSRLELPALTELKGNPVSIYQHHLEVFAGGRISAPNVPRLVGGSLVLLADGTNSQIQLPQVNAFAFFDSNLEVRNGGQVAFTAGTLVVTNARILIQGSGELLTGGLELYAGARLSGGGVFNGAVLNAAGEVRPGTSPGRLLIHGNYVQGSAGKLIVEVGGITPGAGHDVLEVNGAVTLDGTLQTSLVNGFVPNIADTFTILAAASVTGEFSAFSGLDAGNSLEFVPHINTADVMLSLAFSTGPSVISLTPTGTVENVLSTFTVVFSETLSSSTFTTNDVVLTGPGGAIPVTALQRLTPTTWRVTFASQIDEASYAITLGPNINDLAGNAMNQDGDGVNGEASDVFSATVFLQDNDSPRVLSMVPAGHVSSNVASLTITFSEPVVAGSFTLADISVIGPAGAINPVSLTAGSGNSWGVGLPNQSAEGSYTVVVGPNILDAQAQPMAAAFQGTFTIDFGGPRLLAMSPSGGVTQAVAWVELTFSEAILASSLSSADGTLTGPAGAITLGNVQSLGGNRFRLFFTSQAVSGVYTLTIGPNVSDLAGNLMDQDSDGNKGEPIQDVFSGQFSVTSPDLAITEVLAPTSGLPGQIATLIWTVTNRGSATVTRAITEVVSLSDDGVIGGDLRIGSYLFTNALPPNTFVTRTQSVLLPMTGPAGALYVVVETDANRAVSEENETNNAAISVGTLTVPPALAVQFTVTNISEGASPNTFAGQVLRNGDPGSALFVTLTSGDLTELITPETVVIPAGQSAGSFNATVLTDGVPDGAQSVMLTAEANGYLSGGAAITVLDADAPALGLSLVGGTLTEGQAVTATLTRDGDLSQAVAVTVGSSSPGQLNMPHTVTLGVGVGAIEFGVLALDDGFVERTRNYTITASAPDYESAAVAVTIADNDLPVLTVSVDRSSINEGAGPSAATLSIARSFSGAEPFTVDIVRSDASKLNCAASVTFAAGELVKLVPLSAVDDFELDGDQTVTISVFALESLALARIDSGISTSITVLDDDGPRLDLTLERNWLCLSNASFAVLTATVTRNTALQNALTVNLDVAGSLTIPAAVEIPPGAASADFLMQATVSGTAQISASASGFGSGSASIAIHNNCSPDLVIASIGAPLGGVTEAFFSVNYREENVGAAFSITNRPPGITNIHQNVFASLDPFPGGDELLGSVLFDGSVNPYTFLERSATFRLPKIPGDYWIIVEADGSNSVNEIDEGNNFSTSPSPIHVDPAYTATVAAGLETGTAGTPVSLSGSARKFGSSLPAPFELVSITIDVRGTRRVIAALTGQDGNFATTFVPLPGEAGVYSIFASHPGVTNAPAQDTFTLVGMRFAPAALETHLLSLTTATQEVWLENSSDVPLTGLSPALFGAPPELVVMAGVPSTLAGFARVPVALVFQVTTDVELSPTFTLRVTSAEGAVADLTIAATIESLRPRLVATPASLTAGVVPGGQKFVEFAVLNAGGAATGPLNVLLPALPFLSLASSPALSLNPGESTTVVLQLLPAPSQPLGEFHGNLVLATATTSESVPFSFRILSTNTTNVRIEVVDEFTYYAEGAPRVTNALVELRDAVTRSLLAAGISDAAGVVVFSNIVEGYYLLEASAEDHAPYRQSVFVAAGAENFFQPLLPREVVKFYWNVVPTELGDRTRITIESVFETVVPIPVLTVSPSVIDFADFPNGGTINLTVTNHGLLAAQDVRIGFSLFDCWQVTPLISDLGTLAARGSLVVPVTICHDPTCTRTYSECGSAAPAPALAALKAPVIGGVRPHGAGGGGGSTCGGGMLAWKIDCGSASSGGSVPIGAVNAGDAGCGGPWKPQGGGPEGGAFAGSGSSSPAPCDPCKVQLAQAMASCLLNFALPPGWNCLKGIYECLSSIGGDDPIAAMIKCLGAPLDCGVDLGKTFLKPYDIALDLIDCAYGLLKPCNTGSLFGGSDPGSTTQNSAMRVQAFLTSDIPEYPVPGMAEVDLHARRAAAVMQVHEIYFGDHAWLRTGAGPVLTDWLEQLRDATATNSPDAQAISTTERAPLLAHDLRNFLPEAKIAAFLDRWSLTVQNYNLGIFNADQIPSGGNTNFIGLDSFAAYASAASDAINASQAEGYPDVFAGLSAAIERLRQIVFAPQDGVCAQVRIRIDQEAVIARDAFKATLEIENNSSTPLEFITVDLLIFNEQGQDSTGLFGLPAPALTGLAGVNGEGAVSPGTTGRAIWKIIPTSEAAPGTTQTYYVSGSLRYIQDGVAVTVPLSAAPITVHPLAELHLTYFHQRDVLGDDPFTDEIEPSVPFSLAIMVRNGGDGVARNVRITSSQPEIIDNDKGLLVDFDIIATEVAGQNLAPSLTANFGDVNPGEIKIGQWLLKSTLQGLFVEYDATFEHLDGLGDPRLSLVQSIDIHELIRIVRAPGVLEDGFPDMLVNDFADIEGLPDALYLSDGTIVPVSIVTTGSVSSAVSPSTLTVQLSANLPSGWSYLRVPDPGDGAYRLVSVTRSGNVALSMGTNVWLTDRTFIGGGLRPVKENNLHLLDHDSTGVYTLVYALPPVPDITPPTSAVATLPGGSFAEIAVQWSGNDEVNGAGLATFDVYASENGGPFVLWLEDTTARGAIYPGALGHAYAFYSIATDNAGNRESPPSVADASTTVNLVNTPPALVTGADQTVEEGVTVVINNSASDTDSPAQSRTFSLDPVSPPGATINPLTGRVTWRTGEGTGPGTNNVFVIVKDNGVPPLSSTGVVHIVVNEVNSAPTLAPIALRRVNEGTLLTFNLIASDPDLPANTLFYALGEAPRGTAINPLTGRFSWRPGVLQGPSTNAIELIVMDDGVPPLSATQVVQIIVHDAQGDFLVVMGSTNVFAGESSSVPIDLLAGENVARINFNLSGDELRLTNLLLAGARPEIASVSLVPAGSNHSVLTFVAAATQSLPAGATLAQFNFQTTTTGPSTFIPLQPTLLSGELLNGTALTNGLGRAGRIVFIHDEPLLEALRIPFGLTLWGHPLQNYTVESSTNLVPPVFWTPLTNITLTNASSVIPVPSPNPATYYRAVKAP